jgi:hypothetical protein
MAIAVVGVGAVLYLAGLTAVLLWVRGLQRRGVADPGSAGEWYLLAATIGLPIALPLAFTVLSALR